MNAANPAVHTVPCELCGHETTMVYTKRCDWCYELERRIRETPEIAWRVLIRGVGKAIKV